MYRSTEGHDPQRETTRSDSSARPYRVHATRTATTMAALAALSLSGAPAVHAQPAAEQPAATQDDPRPSGPVRTVVPGDSLWSVATAHGISVDELMEYNDLSGDAALEPGQHLRLSPPDEEPAPEAPGPDAGAAEDPHDVHAEDQIGGRAEDPARSGLDYEVVPGDSLWDLAHRHGVTVAEIIEANDLDVSESLKPGRVLQIPAPADDAAGTGGDQPDHRDERAGDGGTAQVVNDFPGYDYDDRTVAAANEQLEQLGERPSVSPAQVQDLVRSTATDMGVDPALALAHAEQESGFDHQVVSPANAVGAMQVIPSAGEWAEGLVGRDLDLLDPRDNVIAGVAIIREHGKRAESRDEAIGAYYQGLHGVQEYGMYPDTKSYVSDVKAKLKAWERS
ncbi:LysM peptidoglycan-binding domain-containing protein [Kocuria coralli]|uniref:LysM peptidoglycan-binding domain-containing protein n=1 Tax=Kocuria coralli TaxID=1461025 RepID=A0A5J5KXR1_9MICC|nr:lytic transglycosylase domain-containing protein [Kocuria coralli]KAA9394434.1 LysM peptidoglycan-binding domain-containing protein [Kocuria coralli]